MDEIYTLTLEYIGWYKLGYIGAQHGFVSR